MMKRIWNQDRNEETRRGDHDDFVHCSISSSSFEVPPAKVITSGEGRTHIGINVENQDAFSERIQVDNISNSQLTVAVVPGTNTNAIAPTNTRTSSAKDKGKKKKKAMKCCVERYFR
jgi:hypothetical protein